MSKLNTSKEGKLRVSVKELMKFNQQVVAETVHGESTVAMQSGCLTYIKGANANSQLGIVIDNDMFQEGDYEHVTRCINVEDIKHIEVMQWFGGSGTQTLFAQYELNLGRGVKAKIPACISEDDMKEQPLIAKALDNLSEDLDIANIKYLNDTTAYTIEVEVYE